MVKHYQALAHAGTVPHEPNPFFYVSSSEWNLYDYIREFAKKNEMPKGIYLVTITTAKVVQTEKLIVE